MSKRRKSYTKIEKLEIVSLSMEAGQNVQELALRFGISKNSIYNWQNTKRPPFWIKETKAMSNSERRIATLEKQLREKELEVEITKKQCISFPIPARYFRVYSSAWK